MDDKEKQHKLKELEKSLAEELDAPSPGPSSAPAPAAAEAKPATETKPADVKDAPAEQKPLSVEDFDALLRESDPDFEKKLNEIKTGIAEATANIDLKGIDIAALIQDDEPDPIIASDPVADEPKIVKKSQFGKKILLLFKSFFGAPISLVKSIREKGIKGALEILKASVPQIRDKLNSEIEDWLIELKIIWNNVKEMSAATMLKLFLLAVTICLLGFFVNLILRGEGLPLPKPETFMGSFGEVADSVKTYDPNSEMENFDSPLRHPEHIVLLKKQIVNLKPSATSSSRPFAAFEIYVEAANQDAAVEIKEREKELLDIASRVAESIGYDDFADKTGKEKFKTVVRREFNKVLNNGRVKKIYFKTVFYKR